MFQQTQGVGTESSDSTLAEGRAALDVLTRNTLFCVSSGNTLLTRLPGEGSN